MDETTRERFQKLSEKIMEAASKVSNMLDAEVKPTTEEVLGAHRLVADIAAEYRELIALVPEKDRALYDRSHGRRVTDLRRLDGQLPNLGTGHAVAKAKDADAFVQQRAPGKSFEDSSQYYRFESGYHVSGIVEAWCGPCEGLTNHRILSVVDGLPKSVLCDTCGSRHAYRTTPARKGPETPTPTRLTPEQVEARKAEEARFALSRELADATGVREFTPRERYKAGEIVNHPEYGRGKIEAVVRGAVVVRFRDGVRSFTTL